MSKLRLAAVAVAVCVAVLGAADVRAASISSAASGAWNNTNTWSPQQIPTAADDVTIIGGTSVTIPTLYGAVAKSVTLQGDIVSPQVLDLDASGASLTVTNGITFTAPGTSVVDQLIVGQGTVTSSGISIDAGSTGTSRMIISTGSVTTGSVTFAGIASNAEVKFTNNGTLTLNGSLGAGGTLVPSTGTVQFTGTGAQSIGSYSFFNLGINKASGTATLLGPITVGVNGSGGDLTITAGTLADNGNQITGNNTGSMAMLGTSEIKLGSGAGSTLLPLFASFSFATTSTVTYQGQAAQSIDATAVYGNLTIDTATATASMSGNTTIAGNVTINSGTLNLATFAHNVAGNWSNGGTVAPGSSTVNFNSNSAAQSISRGTSAFNSIAFSGAGLKSIVGNGLFVNKDVTINAGSNCNFGALLHQIGGNWSNSGTFSGTGSTIDFNAAAGSQSIGSSGFYSISFTGAATKSATGSLTVANNLVINSGATFNPAAFTHNIGGSWTNSGVFTPASSTINFNGGSAQSIGTTTFNNITFTNAGTKTFTGTINVNGGLTVNAGATVSAGSGVNNIAGSMTNNGTLTNVGNTWNFNGSSPQTIAGAGVQFANLTLNNGTGITLFTSILVDNTLALNVGTITTSANTVVINTGGAVTRTSGWVNGELKKKGATGTFTFHVGVNGSYSPVTMVITGTTDMAVAAVAGSGCCVFAGAAHLQHFWKFFPTSAVTANLTFNWLPGEVSGSEPNYILANYFSSSWTYFSGAVDDSTHTATLASQSIPASAVNWIVGEAASLAGTPTITNLSPNNGPVGTIVTLTGTAFTGASAVAFNGTNAVTYSVDNDTQITATAPSGATTGPVTVTTPAGTANSGTFTIASGPTIAAFSPTAGSIGATVIISGTNFTGATAVAFNGTNASFVVDNDTQITTSVPSGATTGQIAVTTPSGTGVSAGNFTVNAPGLIQSAASGNWTSPSTWVGNTTPGTFDQVEILNTHTVTLTTNAACDGLAVNSGGALNIGSNTLTDSASGSFFGSVTGSGTIIFSTNSGATIDGNATIVPPVVFAGDRTFANTSTLSFGSGFSINTGATVTNDGAVHVDNANGITGTGTFTQNANAIVTNGGPFLPAGTLNAAASPNLIDYNGSAQTVKAAIYHDLTLSGSGAKDITGVSAINGSLTLSGTASATATTGLGIGVDVTIGSGTTLGLGTFTHTVGGNWTNSGGSVSQGTSTVIFISSGSQTITRGTQGFASVQFSGVGPKSASGAGLFCTGDVTINAGSNFSGGALAHQVTGNWVNNGTFNTGTSSVEFQGGTSSTIIGDFKTLIVNKSGAATVSLSGTVDASSGTTQLTAGTMVIGTQSLITGSITGSGAITMTTGKIFLTGNSNTWTGTFTPGTGTVEINGSTAQSIRGGTYNNVKINKFTGIATMANALTVNGQLWIALGTLADNGFQMVAGGSATLQIDNSGTLKLGSGATATSLPAFSTFNLTTSSTVFYGAGSALQQINTTPSYGHLVVDSGGATITKTLGGATLNAASLDITNTGGSVTLDLQGKTVNVTGNIGGAGAITFVTSTGNLNVGGNFATTGLFTAGSSTVTFNGNAAQLIRGATYNNLAISNSSATATLTSATVVNGTFTVSAGGSFAMNTSLLRTFGAATNSGTFNAGANTLDLRGDFVNNGTFVAGTGTVAFNGTAAQNWNGTFATSLNNVTVTNAVGVNVNNSMTVNGLFTLNGVNVKIAGGQQIAITSLGSVSRLNASYFIGKLQMFAPSATVTTFHLGTASGYAPVDVTPALSGDINITSNNSPHPNRTGSNVIQRYWTIGTATTTSVDMQFSYNASDIMGAEGIYTAGHYSGAVWDRPATTVNTTTHTATVSGISAYSGDWTVGEPLSLAGSATCVSAPAGVISWWRAEGNAVDDAGTNNGAFNGGATTGGGKVLQAFSLNGSSAYVSAPDSASLHPSNFSVEGWFFVAGGSGTTRMIGSKPVGTGNEDSFIVYVASDDTIAAGVGDAVSTDILTSTVTVSASSWHHFAYTYNGTTQAVYLDGTLANSATTAKTVGYSAAPFLIGADNNSSTFTSFFNGGIDEVTLYNTVLTAGQIAGIYGADSFGKCFSAPAPSISGFTPSNGFVGTSVTINGSGFTGTSSVTFNGTAATYTVVNDTQITTTVPAGATTGSIAVTTAGGTCTTPGSFTVFTGTADLAVSVSGPGSATSGIAFTYTIGVNNLGPNSAGGVTVTSNIPAGVTHNSTSTGAPWSCGFSSPTLTCTATTLGTGAAPNIAVNVTPAGTGTISDSANVSTSSTFDNNGVNDSAFAITTVGPAAADLAVTHSASPATAGVGGTITYTVVTTNNGPSTATGLTITDVLPPNVTYSTATGATCNETAGTVTCTVASLGASSSLTINITTTANAVGTATASATATATETDGNAADNTNIPASASVTGSTVIVTNTNDSGAGSLRQALIEANTGVCTATCNVQFAIGSGAQTIPLASGLPTINVPIVIDGTTQPGYSGTALISIDVNADTTNVPGLNLTGSNSTLRALVVLHAHNHGVILGGSTGGNTIQSCAIKGNDLEGIHVTSGNNTIGGATASLGNAVFANGDSGIVLIGTTASNNIVRSNLIGVDTTGATAWANGIDGVQILDGASGNTIDLNTISGNTNSGVYLTSSGAPTQNNTIQGNRIGTDVSGAFGIGNGVAGIYLGCSAPNNSIGGSTVATRNVIGGNGTGIHNLGCGSDGNVIAGNYIGTAANGTTAISNGIGIELEGGAAQTTIGGTTTSAANLIANNPTAGVKILSPAAGNGILHNTITSNGIGINLDNLPLSTTNDATDSDTGANNLQNAPVISAASLSGSNLNVTLSVDSSSVAATQSLVVELFKADGFGQGKQFLGTQCFNGNNFSTTMTIAGAPVVAGDPITATATSYATACAAPTPTFSDGTSPFSAVINAVCTPPVATVTAPATVCSGSTNNAASVPFTSGAAYNWTITNGSITSGQGSSSILFTANASGSISLGVTATLGCSSTGSATVAIAPATATITASGPTTFCNGGSVNLSANSGTGYQWFKDGNPTGATSQTITATVSGNYHVIVTNGSCSATSAATNVTVNPLPTGAITGPATVCPNAPFTLDAGGPFATYNWSNGANTQTITTLTSFTQTYSVVVTDSNGCSATFSHTVNVSGAPSAVITAPSNVPANSTGLVASVASGANSYNWTITNGTITAGQGTSSITFSIGSSTATLGVTVTTGTCTSTGTKTVTINNLADLSITINGSPDPVAAGGTLTYTVQVKNNGPSFASNVNVNTTLPAGSSFVSASGAGWTCFTNTTVQCAAQSSPVGLNSPITITVTAPANAGPITASTSVSAATPDPTSSNNSASVTTTVGASNCPSPATLIAPANGATGVLSPVSLQWSAVANASSYDVYISVDGSAGTITGSTAGTSLFVNLPSGSIAWFVVAHVPSCGDLTSATSHFTITPGANCGTHSAPSLIAPAQNATATSPVAFSWQPVPEAIGYRLFVSVNGGADQDFGGTDGATTLTHDVPAGSISWVVDALFNGCPSTRSSRNAFIVPQVDGCAGHAAPSLIAPANNITLQSSSIDFHWSAVDGASGYRVWIAVDGTAAAVAGETDATTLHSVISSGVVDWFVEALFDGCASTSSPHFVFTVPHAESCGNTVATLSSPANNSSTTSSIVTFIWSGVAGATGYELYASLDDGTPVLLGGTTGATSLTKEVGAGTLKWFVRALFDGCPSRDSQSFTFVYQPPAACTNNIRPLLATPADGALSVTSPVSFEWSDVGAASYRLFINSELRDTTQQPRRNGLQLATGAYEWYVEASFNGCTSLRSTVSHFTVISKPACVVPAKPTILAPSEVSTGIAYKVRWLPAFGADAYVVQEANNSSFSNATTFPATNDNKLTFSHPSAGTFFYRVRGISDCGSDAGPFSATVGVTILPQNSNDGAASPDAPVTLTYSIALDAALAGASFTATPTHPWLTVTPSTGTVPAGGLTLTVTANTAGLPLGTSLGGVTITTATPSSGRYSSNGNTTSTTTLTVNVVQPVSPTSKSAPPPDALIIPAVAHADGFNSHFQSDVRLTNTSPQVMKYQLTFTPSGETGLANGKQTTIDVDPGRTVALDDVLKTWFSSGSTEGSTGTLEIRPLTTTAAKITSNAISGLANLVTFASSRTFNNASNGTYGQYIPAIPFANFIGKSAGTITLQQIAQSAKYRTNLGIVEGSGQPVSLILSIFGSNGLKIKDVPLDLKGGQHTQLNSFLTTLGLSLEDARVEVKVASGSGRVTAYASVLDNETSDPLLVTPTLLTNSGSTKFVIPGVADLNAWHSDVRIFNASSSKVDAQLMFVSQTGSVQTRPLTLGPNEIKQLDNLLQSTFGITNDGGALHISTASAANLIATARTYNLTTNGTYGQFISAITPNDAAALGTRPLQLLQIEESDRYRTNVGLAEVNGQPAKIEVTVVPPDSKVSAVVQLDLAANEFRQLNQILKQVGMENTYNARVSVQVISGAGRITAYASVIDQQTQDPTLLQAQ